MTQLSLGFSPCPNDTFIFDGLVHHKIDTEGLQFELVLEDVEALNQFAFQEKLDITKLSYHAFAYLTNAYQLLNAGSALGNNCGPLLIAKRMISNEEIPASRIAIPGKYTTANFLLSLAHPTATQKTSVLFSDIEKGVLDGTYDAGLIIHENRFTYAERGLVKLMDLGAYWESLTGAPIPLGGIVIKRNLPVELRQKVDRVLRRSIEYAFANPAASEAYVRAHAQEMDLAVMKQHIELYVNEYSIDLGTKGRTAIQLMFDKAVEQEIIAKTHSDLFV